jgi:polysaccharide export outer membrane protein
MATALQKAARLGLLVSLLGACAAPPKPASPGSALVPAPRDDEQASLISVAKPDLRNEYRLGPDDLVRIDVFQVEGLSRKVRVNNSGEIALPLVGSVSVAHLTANEVEDLLRKKLGERYMQNPQVSVSVEEFISQRVIVDGAVVKPGVYPLTGQMTLLQLFAVANGPAQYADIHKVRVSRTNANGKKDNLFYDVDNIRNGSIKDPVLQGGDVVQVGEDFWKLVWKNIVETVRFSASTTIAPGK